MRKILLMRLRVKSSISEKPQALVRVKLLILVGRNCIIDQTYDVILVFLSFLVLVRLLAVLVGSPSWSPSVNIISLFFILALLLKKKNLFSKKKKIYATYVKILFNACLNNNILSPLH